MSTATTTTTTIKKSTNECEGQPDEFLLIYESESWTRNTAEEPS